jgi:hypothetical protein
MYASRFAPLQDPFGAGMRITTPYAYFGGRLCATISIPTPTSGTIFGMYLIDYHPKGESRRQQRHKCKAQGNQGLLLVEPNWISSGQLPRSVVSPI